MSTTVQACSRCILDTNDDPAITFDEKGVCSYCNKYDNELKHQLFTDTRELERVINEIKAAGKGKPYDCIAGASGGVDSTYVAYLAKKHGLRPLVVHLDNGWDSELAVKNIENIVKKLDVDLYTHVIDWDEFRDLQLAFFKASVVDIELLSDHAIGAVLFHLAKKNDIKYVLSGYNVTTEGILPSPWIWPKHDLLNILDIHRKFGKLRLRTYPTMGLLQKVWYTVGAGIKNVPLLNYIDYSKKDAKETIIREMGWKDYGGKHYESIFTRFYQSYILPRKFGIDKRKAHLSTLICSGQITREEALEELKQPIYDPKKIEEDKEYVIKKLGLTPGEFEDIMRLPVKSHAEYRSYTKGYDKRLAKFFAIMRPLTRLLRGKNNG